MTTDSTEAGKTLPLKWILPPGMVAQRAVNMLIQSGELGEVIVMFFDVRQPIVVGTPEQMAKAIEEVESAEAVCVARLVIPTAKFIEFSEVFGRVSAGIVETLRGEQ